MRLDQAQIKKLSSPYLDGERKKEEWVIEQVEINEDTLHGTVSMRDYCVSATDQDSFHLSYLTALEFVSQLQIIYMHVWAGLKEKNQEAWMAECKMQSHRPIRNPKTISVEMKALKIRQRGDAVYCTAEHRVSDDQGGLFEIWIKALMS